MAVRLIIILCLTWTLESKTLESSCLGCSKDCNTHHSNNDWNDLNKCIQLCIDRYQTDCLSILENARNLTAQDVWPGTFVLISHWYIKQAEFLKGGHPLWTSQQIYTDPLFDFSNQKLKRELRGKVNMNSIEPNVVKKPSDWPVWIPYTGPMLFFPGNLHPNLQPPSNVISEYEAVQAPRNEKNHSPETKRRISVHAIEPRTEVPFGSTASDYIHQELITAEPMQQHITPTWLPTNAVPDGQKLAQTVRKPSIKKQIVENGTDSESEDVSREKFPLGGGHKSRSWYDEPSADYAKPWRGYPYPRGGRHAYDENPHDAVRHDRRYMPGGR